MVQGLVSIVMPAKNVEKYIVECIESILAQTERNWELVVVDDHSSDATFSILENYATTENRIRVLRNKGNGIIPALQLAYSHTQGEFIHRMDADDIMIAEKLEKLKICLLQHGKQTVATAKVKYFAADGLSEGYIQYQDWLNSLCDNNNHWEEIYKECVVPSPCWMLYRSDFNASGGFNANLYPEDYDLCFRWYRAKFNVVAVKEILHLWRDYNERTSRNHEHYKNNNFFQIKLTHFLEEDYDPKKSLMVWGAGNNGKTLAKLLQKKNIPFEWLSNNPNKHGKDIYNQLMQSFEILIDKENPQILITVAQRNAKKEIIRFLNTLQLVENQDFYFFR